MPVFPAEPIWVILAKSDCDSIALRDEVMHKSEYSVLLFNLSDPILRLMIPSRNMRKNEPLTEERQIRLLHRAQDNSRHTLPFPASCH